MSKREENREVAYLKQQTQDRLVSFVRNHPTLNSYSDQANAYVKVGKEYAHQVINHAETYVQGNVHTNCIENYWSLLKRGIKGTYVSVEPFHLFRYLDDPWAELNQLRHGSSGNT